MQTAGTTEFLAPLLVLPHYFQIIFLQHSSIILKVEEKQMELLTWLILKLFQHGLNKLSLLFFNHLQTSLSFRQVFFTLRNNPFACCLTVKQLERTGGWPCQGNCPTNDIIRVGPQTYIQERPKYSYVAESCNSSFLKDLNNQKAKSKTNYKRNQYTFSLNFQNGKQQGNGSILTEALKSNDL